MGIALTLTGCSGGPSDSDVEKEVRSIAEGRSAMLKRLGRPEDQLPKLVSVENIDCEKDKTSAGYVCSLDASTTDPVNGDSKGTKRVTLFESNEGWTVRNS